MHRVPAVLADDLTVVFFSESLGSDGGWWGSGKNRKLQKIAEARTLINCFLWSWPPFLHVVSYLLQPSQVTATSCQEFDTAKADLERQANQNDTEVLDSSGIHCSVAQRSFN